MRDQLPDINDGLLAAARGGADLILLSQVSVLGGYDIARGLGIPSAGVFVVPIHEVLGGGVASGPEQAAARLGQLLDIEASVELAREVRGLPRSPHV